MNLPHRVAFLIKPVDEIFTNMFLPLVTSMTDANVVPLGYPGQHFHRNYRVSVLWLVATGRNDRDCVLLEEGFSEDKVAGRGNGQTGCERVNVGDLTEQFTKLKTATSKNVHIRLAVPKNFSREIELVLMFHPVRTSECRREILSSSLYSLKIISNINKIDLTIAMPSNSITEESLVKILDQKLKPLEDKMEGLVKSVEFISAKYDELLIKHQYIEEMSNGLVKENQLLKKQVFNLQNQSEQMCVNFNELEQYGRQDCLEIRGIPVQEGEDTDTLVCSIGNLVNVNIKAEDISISHRLKSNPTARNQSPAIIAKFVRRSMRDKLYHARKYLKEKSTKDVGLGTISEKKIYIAESLTRKNKILFNKCLEIKKSLNYKYIWTNQGNIYLRRDSSSPKKLISTTNDLDSLAR